MSQNQKDSMLDAQTKYAAPLAPVFAVVGVVIGALVITLVYWGAFNLFSGAGLAFGKSFGITSHAFMPSVIASVLTIITLLLKQRSDVDPEHLLASNVGALLSEDSAHWLQVLGQSLDLFWIWSLILLAIGYAAANPKKIKTGSAFGIVFGLWILWVLVRVGWAAM